MSTALIILGVMIFHFATLFVFEKKTKGLVRWFNLNDLPMSFVLCTPILGTFVMCAHLFTHHGLNEGTK